MKFEPATFAVEEPRGLGKPMSDKQTKTKNQNRIMNYTQIITLIEQLLGVANAIAPVIEQTHPAGSGSAAKVQEGLAVANAAVQALKPSTQTAIVK
jgi:hypothetical protein